MIQINKNAQEQRIQILFVEAEQKIKRLAAQGHTYFRINFLVANREELGRVLDKLEEDHNIFVSYKGLAYDGYSGDMKSFTVKLGIH